MTQATLFRVEGDQLQTHRPDLRLLGSHQVSPPTRREDRRRAVAVPLLSISPQPPFTGQ
jgi:hypothetical protein